MSLVFFLQCSSVNVIYRSCGFRRAREFCSVRVRDAWHSASSLPTCVCFEQRTALLLCHCLLTVWKINMKCLGKMHHCQMYIHCAVRHLDCFFFNLRKTENFVNSIKRKKKETCLKHPLVAWLSI